MADETTLAIGAGIAQGLEKATANLFNVMVATNELKSTAAKNEIEAKKSKLELQKLEYDLSPEELELHRKETEAKIKAQKSLDQFNIIRAHKEAVTLRNEVKGHQKSLEFMDMVIRGKGPANVGYTVSPKGGVTIRGGSTGAGKQPFTADQVLKKATELAEAAKQDYTPVTQGEIESQMENARGLFNKDGGVGAGAAIQEPAAQEMPDATEYAEGTEAEDEAGVKWKVVNGIWEQA